MRQDSPFCAVSASGLFGDLGQLEDLSHSRGRLEMSVNPTGLGSLRYPHWHRVDLERIPQLLVLYFVHMSVDHNKALLKNFLIFKLLL
jgi:hypothetical protein